MRYQAGLILFISFFSSLSFANYEVQKLLDSYMVAKAEVSREPMSEKEVKQTPYTIQVASYINEKDAVSHVEELKVQEKDVQYFPVFIRGQVWFKVCVGKFDTKEKAEQYKKDFVKRMEEPFATVISLLDRPTNIKEPVNKKEQISEKKSSERTPSSVATKDKVVVPTNSESSAGVSAPVPEVKLIAKSKMNSVDAKSHIYSLQIGAYPSEEVAKERMSVLPVKDQSVYYEAAQVKGQKWFRLFVGKFESKRDAEEYQKKFHEMVKNAESLIRRKPASE